MTSCALYIYCAHFASKQHLITDWCAGLYVTLGNVSDPRAVLRREGNVRGGAWVHAPVASWLLLSRHTSQPSIVTKVTRPPLMTVSWSTAKSWSLMPIGSTWFIGHGIRCSNIRQITWKLSVSPIEERGSMLTGKSTPCSHHHHNYAFTLICVSFLTSC